MSARDMMIISELWIMKCEDSKMSKEKLFISYNWKDGNSYADELETQLGEKFDVKRDKTQLIANDDIFDFMAEIANCENVIIVLTAEYVKSINCMLEMSYLVKQDDWEMKSMVLVVDESIYTTENKLNIISYWNDYQKQLSDRIESTAQGKSILEDEKARIDYICQEVETFLKGISRRKNPSQIAIVNEFIKKSDRNKIKKQSFMEQGEQYVRKFLKEKGSLTIRELSEGSGKSVAYSHRIVSDLVGKGVLEKSGIGKNIKYSLKNNS